MKIRRIIIGCLIFMPFILSGCSQTPDENLFSGEMAYQYLHAILDFGSRIPGSSGSRNAAAYMETALEKNDWQVTMQDFLFEGVPLQNIIAKKGNGETLIIIATHYDTRAAADRESDSQKQGNPVPGANDGGSGSAVLLELSRVLPISADIEVWLVFFDAEDQGNINSWNWSVGAEYFVHHLPQFPSKVLIIDMIGDEDLTIYQEKNSTQTLVDEIWNVADDLGYHAVFIPQEKYALLDDHLPFINAGIPAALLIDFDYPYWHTTDDTIEHVSVDSLQMIGDLLMRWISEQ